MRIAHALILILAVAGCQKKGDGIVVVTVDASATVANVSSFRVTATAGRTVMFDIALPAGTTIPPAQTFGISVPASVTGTMNVHVDARDDGNNVVGSGDGSASIVTNGRADLPVTLTVGSEQPDLGNGDGPIQLPTTLVFSPTSYQWPGEVTKGTAATMTQTLTLTNSGTIDSTMLPSAALSGSEPSSFVIMSDGCGGKILGVGLACQIVVQYKPLKAGKNSATLAIGTLTVALSGHGLGAWTSQFASTPGLFFRGLALPSAGNVFAGGDIINTHSIYFSAGDGTWTGQASPALAFQALSSPDATSVFATAISGKMWKGVPATASASWNEVPFDSPPPAPTPPQALYFGGAYAASATSVYLAGSQYSQSTGVASQSYILHWTSTSEPNQVPALTSVNFLGIHGSSEGNMFAVGSGGAIYHSIGDGTWVSQTSHSAGAAFRAVYVIAADEAWAVGYDNTVVPGVAVVDHYTTSAGWTPITVGAALPTFPSNTNPEAVWASAPDDLWVVGAAIYHSFDGGATWYQHTSPAGGVQYAIRGFNDHDIYIAGEDGLLIHYQ